MSGRPHRDILHLDLDAFYASVEVLDDPSLEGKPVIVGGSERRGVVCAASYEARKFGVHSAQPTATAKRLCPRGIFLPVRMERYRKLSDRVFEIFRRFTPLVEALSIDEAFLDVTASTRLFGEAERIARKIKTCVREETELTVSAGVAGNKLVAKIASDLGKPDGLMVVPRGTERKFLAPLPVGRLWGVGKVTREALRRMGVATIGDLSGIPSEVLAKKFGRHGVLLHELSRGIDEREVVPEQEAKSIGHEDTYPEDLVNVNDVQKELLSLAGRVAERLRRQGVKGRTITLKVKYHDFTLITRAVTLDRGTDDGGEIYRGVLELLRKTEAGKRPVRLLGISLSHLSSGGEGSKAQESPEQLPLFKSHPPERAVGGAAGLPVSREKKEKLNRTVDRIRERFGKKGIRPAALLDEE
ncbi:MAG: DNA polymerase IV [Deltaproteobacteria bacterium]|nr:DNA polymerase IV [Deltaproteobacteria bacterium]PWB61835.1 MAG: DNA polymerase IV [Deltaproteobacteria bacterium]